MIACMKASSSDMGTTDLELLGHLRLVERAAAVGASGRQRCLVDLVDLLGGRRLTVGLGAVVLARLATGSFGVRPGACRHGGPRRVDGGGARSWLARRGPVTNGIGSWHTAPIPSRNYTQQRAVQLRRWQAGNGSAGAWA